MKKILFLSIVMIASISFAEGEHQPCMQIKKACEAAGFQKGKAKEGKGLIKDCMKKLTNGESVPGVSLSPKVISACKEKHDK